MGFREVSVVGVKEILRLWLLGHGQRAVGRLAQVDRKTVCRYVDAAQEAGLQRGDSEDKLTDELVGAVIEAVRPGRPPGDHGSSWELLREHKDFIKARVDKKLTLVKVHNQLHRHTGHELPYSTFHRFCVTELGSGRDRSTVRIADCDPGQELQIDFGRMGLLFDLDSARRRVVHALILSAVYSRHMFVWLTFKQNLESVIAGCEAAWAFFGGTFKVVIPDNLKAIVIRADPIAPRLNDAFVEYAQARGFVIDPARVRRAKDKARVERVVPYVRESFFRGEDFLGLLDAQRRAETWCVTEAGMRIHGTTQRRPAEVFKAEELPTLAPPPQRTYDLPLWCEPKAHPDHHIEVQKALYSVPGDLIGRHVKARADAQLVKVFYAGKVVKVHPRKGPGGRSTDAVDLPEGKSAYALRDINRLKQIAASNGANVGTYAARLLDIELPWTKMRMVYRLLGLVRRFSAARVDEACAKALEFDVVDVNLIARMLERALESRPVTEPAPSAQVIPLRFARAAEEFRPSGGDGRTP
jgi:transposase